MGIFLGLAAGIAALFFGGEWLVTGASRLARSLGISALIVGLTIVAMGTSMPELLVSVNAALVGAADISIGNIVGSNTANIGLILGLSGLIYPISVHVDVLRREIPIMIGVAVLAYLLMMDGQVNAVDGLIFLAGMAGYLGFMVFAARKEQQIKHDIPEDAEPPIQVNRLLEAGRLVVGIAVLMVGAQLTVTNATELARALGISELIIGVTLVAVGTSLPELVTSTMAAFRRESDIAIGNVVGSNIFNILGILGVTSVINPVGVSPQLINFDGFVMIGFSLLVLPFAMNRKLGRLESAVFLLAYVGYVVITVMSGLSLPA
jgi:cation:H+ antiporter